LPHLHRFFLEDIPATGSGAMLEGEEAHHALHAVRLRVGEIAGLFDGRGKRATARVTATSRHDVSLEILDAAETAAPGFRLTLAVGWLHQAKSLDFVVRHGTEVGVSRFVFFRAEHSERAPQGMNKFERVAIEACKQSGRDWLPSITACDDLAAAFEACPGERYIARIDEASPPPRGIDGIGEAALFIGPEGDFSPTELALAAATGARPISLGSAVYRTEMAALVGATLLLYEAGELLRAH